MQSQTYTSPDGVDVHIFTLENKNGMQVRLTDFGAAIMDIATTDRNGKSAELLLTYDSPQGFIDGCCFFGATVGRYANRIARSHFKLDGVDYQLAANEGRNHLHGGLKGFDHMLWDAEADGSSVRMTYLSRDGEEGYPGNLKAAVQFTLDDDSGLWLHYTATTDQATVVNLTNHSYFNLAGHDAGDINSHLMYIAADAYTPIDDELIPTGEIAKVDGTPLDFRTPHKIGERIDHDFRQLKLAGGYDHNYVLNGVGMRVAARVFEPESGRLMTVLTDSPCMQFYSGNMIKNVSGRCGVVYQKRGAFCLETQMAPDSPNRPEFPSVVLRPGEVYDCTTCYRFGVADSIDVQE